MRVRLMLAALVMGLFALSGATLATTVHITINKVSQKMTVKVDGETEYVWPVSTGARGYETPSGKYRPFRMEKDHFSKEWDDAPMPHSIFFTTRGHAIHGSNHPGLGTPASHGCVRLSLTNASTLYGLVEERGMSSTKVVVRGADPPGYHAPTDIPTASAPQQKRRGLFRGLFGR
jgi:lipoprotein-anchoring transpeptidase ErfK/SrfK